MDWSFAETQDNFVAYTDGSCLGNPGKGGWAYIVLTENGCEAAASGIGHTTNSKAELEAVIGLLRSLSADAVGTVYSDSRYVVDGCMLWRHSWERNKWRLSSKKPVANVEYWKTISDLLDDRPGIRFEWIKAHADNAFNNEVHDLAHTAAREQKDYKDVVRFSVDFAVA